MKKSLFPVFILLLLLISFRVNAQQYSSTSSEVSFFSKAPLEDIHAVNKEAKSVISAANNSVGVVMGIRSFKFKNALMEEHFNENYLESHKYKTSTFMGKINENIDFTKDGIYTVTATGILELKGVKQERTIPGILEIMGDKLNLKSEFDIALKDHNIKIPRAVVMKIAEVVKVTAEFNYELK
jgi:polyisoprenoid-binding protein YceI